MEKDKKGNKNNPPVSDRTIWYDSINFMPEDLKNELWAAQNLFFIKQNSVRFLDPKKMREYRKLDNLELNKQEYIDLIDPKSAMGGGGKAEYFSSDFKANPIDVHLDNIVRAKLDKICLENQLQVHEIDKYAKSQKQKDKDKIIYQHQFRRIINEVNAMLGLPEMKDGQDPYNYVKSLGKADTDSLVGSVDNYLDYIKSQIKDSHDLTLYEASIYKGDIERCLELGIEHYLIKLNKWRNWCEYFNNDLKNFNRFCGEWYTDDTSGRGTVSYFEPDTLWTSPFKQKNGEDITYWFHEEDITFADFIRRFGATMTEEQLKEVFELNRQNGNHNLSWSGAKGAKGSQAKVRIGRASILTQDADKFSEEYVNNKIPILAKKPPSWLPIDKDTGKVRQKIYNVWYSFYYVPPTQGRLGTNTQVDWEWQKNFIFRLKKNVDMYRYGIDLRYAKSSLVLWKDDRPSFMDIKQAFMPKIHTTWHKFQNCLVQDTTALVMSKDFITGLLKASDESNKINLGDEEGSTGGNGRDPSEEAIKSLRQGGLSFMNFRDSNGNLVADPTKLFVFIDSKHLDKAERYLRLIMEQYNMMTMSLAQNDLTEGGDAKPRTNSVSVQASLQSAQNGIWFIEKPVRECMMMFGERTVQWILMVIKEHKKYGFSQRFEEMKNVIGIGNALCLESIEDLNPEEIGVSVELEDVRAMKDYYVNLTNQYLKDGKIAEEDISLIISTIQQNYKYGAVLLSISAKKRTQEMAHREDLAFQRQMKLEQQKMESAQMMLKAKTDNKIREIEASGQVEAKLDQMMAMLKTQSQKEITQSRTDGRIAQDAHKIEKKSQEENQKPFAPANL